MLARSQAAYRDLGVRVSTLPRAEMGELAVELVGWLRKPPSAGNMRNALQHMWGHVETGPDGIEDCSPGTALKRVQRTALAENNRYLLEQTALTELGPWM